MPATKSSCKKAKTKAEKAFKKKPDPAGKSMIEQADALMKDQKFDDAEAKYKEAETTCSNSTAQKVTKPNDNKPKKAPAPPKEAKKEEEEAAVDESALLPQPGQKIAKGTEESTPNYAVNTDDMLEQLKKDTGGKWRTRFPPEPNG
jgi:glutaminyl-tRNA synthetase